MTSLLVNRASTIISRCYSVSVNEEDVSQIRQIVWSSRTEKSYSCAPKVASLASISEAFVENVKRAHLQSCVWKHACDPTLLATDPLDYG